LHDVKESKAVGKGKAQDKTKSITKEDEELKEEKVGGFRSDNLRGCMFCLSRSTFLRQAQRLEALILAVPKPPASYFLAAAAYRGGVSSIKLRFSQAEQ